MRLVIDTNILVSELLRKRGRDLIELFELQKIMISLVVAVQLGQKIADGVQLTEKQYFCSPSIYTDK